MNNSLKNSSLQLLYVHFKNSAMYPISVIIFILLIAAFLVFYVIIPQYDQWFSIQNEVADTKAKLDVVNNNLNFIGSLDKKKLNDKLKVASSALPLEKDFAPVIGAIADAAIEAGVSTEDYSFRVGRIASNSAEGATLYSANAISLAIVVNIPVTDVQKFVRAIERKLPLSSVTSLEADSRSTTISVSFLNKPYVSKPFNDETSIKRLTRDQETLLKQMAEWKASSSAPLNIASSSAQASSSSMVVF